MVAEHVTTFVGSNVQSSQTEYIVKECGGLKLIILTMQTNKK